MPATPQRLSLIAALVIAGLAAHPARGESREIYTSALTVNPIEMFSGTFNMEYEQAFNQSMSWYAGLNYLYFTGISRHDTNASTVLGPEAGLRLYLIGDAPAGVWIGPYLGVAYVHNTGSSNPDSIGYGLGAMAGVNLMLGRMNVSLGLGTGWVDYSSAVNGARVGLYGLIPRSRIALGVFF